MRRVAELLSKKSKAMFNPNAVTPKVRAGHSQFWHQHTVIDVTLRCQMLLQEGGIEKVRGGKVQELQDALLRDFMLHESSWPAEPGPFLHDEVIDMCRTAFTAILPEVLDNHRQVSAQSAANLRDTYAPCSLYHPITSLTAACRRYRP